MFSSPLSLHYTGSRNQTETHNDDTTAVTAVNLVLDSLTPKLAKQLSREVHDLCFGGDGQIHASVSKLTVRLREPQQRVIVRMASDTDPHCVLANVRIPTISITKRGEDQDEGVERKSRKVAPAAETLRATLNCLMLPESHEARAFLCQMPGKTFVFEFGDEEQQLDFGTDDDEKDEDPNEPKQARLRNTGGDDEAGDILEEQLILKTLAEFSVEMTAKRLAQCSAPERAQLLEWAQDVKVLNENPNTKADDLPKPPAFLFSPKRVTKAAVQQVAKAAAATDRKPRAPRRSSAEFKNSPKMAGKVTSIKGHKRPKAVN